MAVEDVRYSTCLKWGSHELDFSGRTLVMGILNVTPDSFSDGGMYAQPHRAVVHGLKMVADGVDIIDIGGQSTRPGSAGVGAAVEIERVVPVIAELVRQVDIPISIDTTESAVAQAALDAGASIINDISALRFDDRMAGVAAGRKVPVILMHMLGTPATMQKDPQYDDVVREIKAFLRERLDYAMKCGIAEDMTIIDVGIGFGKRIEHNVELLSRIDEFFELGRPVLVGHSRKRFLGEMLGLEANERDSATLAASCFLAGKGVHIVRVHDVARTRKAMELYSRFARS